MELIIRSKFPKLPYGRPIKKIPEAPLIEWAKAKGIPQNFHGYLIKQVQEFHVERFRAKSV